MMVDLNLEGRSALVIAESREAEVRVEQLLAEGAAVSVLMLGKPSVELRRAFESGRLICLEAELGGGKKWRSALSEVRPFLTIISSGSARTDAEIAKYARAVSRLVYVVDRPKLNDLNMTGVARFGDIRVAVSTRGTSPAMAGILRRKIESIISKEDVLQVKLQGELRGIIRRSVRQPAQRKRLIYRIIRNRKILSLLKSGRFEEAKSHALRVVGIFLEIQAANSKQKGQVVTVSCRTHQ